MQILSAIDAQTQLILVVIFSLIFGSFVTLLSYRLTSNQPIVFTRSKCVRCNALLTPLNLIPIFSWLFQRGKCRKCLGKISARYPLIELSFLLSFLAIYFVLDQQINLKTIIYFLIASTLILMCIIDLEQYFIPDSSQYFLTILAAILLLSQGSNAEILSHVKSAFLYIGFGLALLAFFYFTTSLEAIGIDDLKFFFVSGFMLGSENFLAFMMLSGFLGVIFGFLWQKITKDETFPFAPAICVSSFVCLLFGTKIDPVNLMGNLIF
jgi:prepilin signal peptidase PulO-like enzyme (type II secretory pathway)